MFLTYHYRRNFLKGRCAPADGPPRLPCGPSRLCISLGPARPTRALQEVPSRGTSPSARDPKESSSFGSSLHVSSPLKLETQRPEPAHLVPRETRGPRARGAPEATRVRASPCAVSHPASRSRPSRPASGPHCSPGRAQSFQTPASQKLHTTPARTRGGRQLTIGISKSLVKSCCFTTQRVQHRVHTRVTRFT